MKLSVIFSTYNSPDWMEKTLWGLHYQTYQDFEIVIADDGSDAETKARIEQFERDSGRKIIHVWQEDDGFQKTRILNKALLATTGEYIVFTDGDCVCRNDFLQVHVDNAQPGYFLSGGYFKLPMAASKAMTREHIASGLAFDVDFLVDHGLKPNYNGHNASTFRDSIFATNGFDERMQYGGEDREMGERLFNMGIKSKQIRYSAICIYLDHARGYVKPEMISKNKAIRKYTKENKVLRTPFGIEKD